MAKAGWREFWLPQVMEGGVSVMWKDRRSKKRARSGSGMARVVH